ncbi:hypothetical protein OSB04_023984 [Centaurea solstitialis]|uniref:CCHC-type domain-containing protein n=1 Tax=Centaurea solstitialis TaxID=347529 RepID=A0AA38W2Q9_9ASTR|nr:hypothetical protein OSB04_023984 [Centaurea solstitialis]
MISQYESFIHQKDETLSQIHQRLNCLLIDLKTIGTIYPNSEVVTKFMEALPEHWEIYTSCLTMSKDIKTLTLRELLPKKGDFQRRKPLTITDKPKTESVDKATATCYNCQGKGHFANDCRYKKNQFAPSSTKSSS